MVALRAFMVYAGVLPYADVEVKNAPAGAVRFYLLGLENAEYEYDRDLWSDFGGGAHYPTDLARSAAEEFYEETMGAFGDASEIETRLRKSDAIRLPKKAGIMYLMKIKFDPELPRMWNGMWRYFARCSRNKGGKWIIPSCPEGYFEKKRIAWFTAKEILSRHDIRPVFKRSFKLL